MSNIRDFAGEEPRLNVREGPGKQFAVLRTVAKATETTPICHTTGPDGIKWYKLEEGGWMIEGNYNPRPEGLPACEEAPPAS